MANMSYCRFYNTNLDLGDCLKALKNGEKLSKEEFASCESMFRKFIDFCCGEGIIEEDRELNSRLEDFFEGINRE